MKSSPTSTVSASERAHLHSFGQLFGLLLLGFGPTLAFRCSLTVFSKIRY